MKNDKQKLFEAFEKVCKIKLIKEEKSPKETLKDHLIELINLEPYDNLEFINQYAKGEQKIIEMFKIYKSEKQYELDRGISVKNSLEDWLRGLPTVLSSMPIYYDELTNLLYALGYIDDRDTDDDIIDKLYYSELVNIILDTIK